MRQHTGILWFRNDLRLHDNEALTEAVSKCDFLLPVYVFDDRLLNNSEIGYRKMGGHRFRVLIEALNELAEGLRFYGSDLLVLVGKPEEVLFSLAAQLKSSWIFCNRERTDEEERVQNALEKNMWSIGQEVLFFRGKMLIHTADLPFPVGHTPDTFTQFRKEVESFVAIRAPMPVPTEIPPLPQGCHIKSDWHDFFEKFTLDADIRGSVPFRIGEKSGLERIQNYFFVNKNVSTYKDTRNGQIGADYSTKFSPFLALGALSPKTIYAELRRYEAEFGSTEHTYWVYFELLWRDFFRFQAKKYGNRIFKIYGTHGKPGMQKLKNDKVLFQSWCNGETGKPFVDANMRELNATGFMSNRGRQNVASYLVHDLKVNWLWGAAYFEHHLIDYDPCSNYGNWAYIAGVGTDPRLDRYFNVIGQGKRYDPDGDFIKLWIPSLKRCSVENIHEPSLNYLKKEQNSKLELLC
jgi:deoxyribodipyrimidine photo-lyase